MGKLERGKVHFHYICDDCGLFMRQIALYSYRPRPKLAAGMVGSLAMYLALLRRIVRRG